MSAAQYTDPTTLDGVLKPIFGEMQWLLPYDCLVQRNTPFSVADAVGKDFEEPLQVKTSWGVTFAGSAGDVVALNDAQPSKTVSAVVKPFLTILGDKISYGMFDRGGPGAGKKAFISTSTYTMKNLTQQLRRVLEMSMLCGQDGFGIIESYSTGTIATGRLVVTAATLRTGILAFLEGAKLDISDAATTTLIADGSAGNAAGVEVLAVNIDNRTIDFVALPTLGAGGTVVPAAGQTLFIHGANPSVSATANYMEMVGMQKQIQAVTGTVFGINKATYQATRGNVVPAVGAISAGALTTGAAKAINRGFQGEMWAYVSPLTWGDLNARNIAQRVFDSSYKKGEAAVGTDALKVSANGVTLDVRSHSMMSDSTYMLIPKEGPKRIGSSYENSGVDAEGEDINTDISFMIPGTSDKFVQPVAGFTAVKVECRSDQAIYLPKPAHCVLGTGISHT